jgi:hypothetical protein
MYGKKRGLINEKILAALLGLFVSGVSAADNAPSKET